MTMNGIVTVFLCFSFFFAIQCMTDEEKKAIHLECSAKTGVSEEAIMNALKGDFSEDPKFKEHLFCFSKKMGFQNEAGEIQLDGIRAKLVTVIPDEAVVDTIMAKCGVDQGTPEDTAFESFKCMYAAKHS